MYSTNPSCLPLSALFLTAPYKVIQGDAAEEDRPEDNERKYAKGD